MFIEFDRSYPFPPDLLNAINKCYEGMRKILEKLYFKIKILNLNIFFIVNNL